MSLSNCCFESGIQGINSESQISTNDLYEIIYREQTFEDNRQHPSRRLRFYRAHRTITIVIVEAQQAQDRLDAFIQKQKTLRQLRPIQEVSIPGVLEVHERRATALYSAIFRSCPHHEQHEIRLLLEHRQDLCLNGEGPTQAARSTV